MHGNGNWLDALIDSVLAGAAQVVALLAAMTFAGVRADPTGVGFAAVVAFASAFVFTLQAARGRSKNKVTPYRGKGSRGG